MATADRVLAVKLIGDVSDINKGLKGVTGRFKSMKHEAASWIKAFAGAEIINGISAVGDALGQAFGDLKEQDKLLKQTTQVIKTTGGAAKISAKGVVELSSSLEDLSGIDQEAIQNAENLLLTFTKIKGPIFTGATKVVLDMSIALGEDLKSASIQVGKALNDPIKGITALSRVGVSFDDQQKKVIAALIKTGDVAGAQKVILRELNKEFGGSAKAFGSSLEGRLAKINQKFGNIAQNVVKAVLPAFTDLVGIVDDLAGGNLDAAGKGIERLLFGYDKLIKKRPKGGGHKVTVGVEHVEGLSDQVQRIAGTITGGLQDAIGSLAKVDLTKVFTFDNLADAFHTAIQLLQTNQSVLTAIAIAGGAFAIALSGAMFVASVFIEAMTGMIKAPVWVVDKVLHLALVGTGKALGVTFAAGLFASKILIDAITTTMGTLVTLAGTAGGTFALALAGFGAAIGLAIVGGIASYIAGHLLDAIVNTAHAVLPGWLWDAVSNNLPLGPGDLPHHARGTTNAPGGWSVVGEEGPELVNLRRGSTVLSNRQSMGAMGGIHLHYSPQYSTASPIEAQRFINSMMPQLRRALAGSPL